MKEKSWNDSYIKLIKYFERNKTHHIKYSDTANTRIRLWSNSQRLLHHKGALHQSRVILLNQINFDFYPDDTKWNKWYDQLCIALKTEGRNLPFKYRKNPKLGIWLYNQKRRFTKGTMPSHRIKKLQELNIAWIID